MTIYLDYVFLINFLFDFIILYGINTILKRNTNKKRIILGSLFGGLSAFILFLSIKGILFFLIKMLLGIIMLIITFSYKNIKYTFTNLIYLVVLSIVLGGSLYLINIELGNPSSGVIFFTNSFSLNNILILMISIFIIVLYIHLNKHYKNNLSNLYSVTLYNNSDILNLTGYLDTGNNLYDPYFNKPILVLNKNINLKSNKYIYVPYNTISGKSLMKCFLIDKIFIKEIGYKHNVLIGLSNDKFSLGDVDIILHKELM